MKQWAIWPRQSWAFISWWRTRMSPSCLTTKHCTIFASALWSWPHQHTVTWTTWCLLLWVVWPAACVSQDSWTVTCARLQWTLCHSHVCTSSWLALHHWPPVVLSSIVHWPCPSWPSRCSVVKHVRTCCFESLSVFLLTTCFPGFRWFPKPTLSL